MVTGYDPAADPVHGGGWNSAARWGGWEWREPRYAEHWRTCSFCGSVHPADLAAEQPFADGSKAPCTVCGKAGWQECLSGQAVGPGFHSYAPEGWYASWADRKYGWPHKFYVENLTPRDPGLLRCTGHANFEGAGANFIPAAELTDEQRAVILADGMGGKDEIEGWYQFGTKPPFAKFYSIHLADPALDPEIRKAVELASGLAFTFTADGKVSWHSSREDQPGE